MRSFFVRHFWYERLGWRVDDGCILIVAIIGLVQPGAEPDAEVSGEQCPWYHGMILANPIHVCFLIEQQASYVSHGRQLCSSGHRKVV